MRLFPPVMSAIFPSSLPMHFSLVELRLQRARRSPESARIHPVGMRLQHLVVNLFCGRRLGCSVEVPCLRSTPLEVRDPSRQPPPHLSPCPPPPPSRPL